MFLPIYFFRDIFYFYFKIEYIHFVYNMLLCLTYLSWGEVCYIVCAVVLGG